MSFDIPAPKGWELVKLSDLGEVNRGRSRHRPRYAEHLYGGPYPFIQTGDVKASGGRITEFTQTYSEAGLAQSRLWPTGTLCITIAANIAETGILAFPACFPDSVIGFIADESKCNVYFVEYMFRLLRARIQAQATGSVQDNINLQTLDRIQFPIPSLEEQNRIVGILNAFDGKLLINTQTNQTLEQMAQALFKSWFVDFDPVIDNALDSGFFDQLAAGDGIPEPLAARVNVRNNVRNNARNHVRNINVQQAMRHGTNQATPSAMGQPLPADIRALFPSSFVEHPDLGWIPEGWEAGCLADVASYSSNRIATAELSLANYVSTENMLVEKKGIVEAANLPTVTTVPAYTTGNVLISNIRPYFKKIWMANGDGGHSNDVLGFVANAPDTEGYLFNLLYQDAMFDFMMTTSKGSKMPRGDKKAIMGWPLVIPPCDLRKFFSERVVAFYILNSYRVEENKTLANLRDTLLPKLLSGELTLAEDGPEGYWAD